MCERNYQIENIKIILIFCVILGHLLEIIGGGDYLYKIIYSFHMPVFLIINGWFAPRKYASMKTIFKLLYPYVLFQFLYQCFNTYVINEDGVEFNVQFGTPYWLLWYLVSLIFYYLLIPVIATESTKYAKVILFGTLIMAIAIGFDNSVGYYMSLSRTFAFFPFFVFGYYTGHGVFKIYDIIQKARSRKIVKLTAVILMFIICVIMFRQNLGGGSLYGSFSYEQGKFMWYIRLELIMVAYTWSVVFMILTPNRKILTKLDTFPIYVMHGFIILFLKKHNPFMYSFSVNLLIASLICIIVIILFGNKYMSRIIGFFFRGEWVIKIWNMVFERKYGEKSRR